MDKNKLFDNTKTYFIKKVKNSSEIEGVWIGKVSQFSEGQYNDEPSITFKVAIEQSISLDELPQKYRKYKEGWYIDESFEIDQGIKETKYDPQFISLLFSTTSWSEFEEYTYFLLKALGLHETIKFPANQQRGKADGFFKFNTIAVLYDCTLETHFDETKATQLDNYCAQLIKGNFQQNIRRIEFGNCTKRVWIITRGGVQRQIQKINEISIKEVPIEKIIDLYRQRFIEDMDAQELERRLLDL